MKKNYNNPPLINLLNVGRSFGTGQVWISSLNIERGRMVALVGASGSGKSTVLNLVGALSRSDLMTGNGLPSVENVRGQNFKATLLINQDLCEFDLLSSDTKQYRQRIGYVFQTPFLISTATATANIELGAVTANRYLDAADIFKLSGRLRLAPEFLNQPIHLRSGGEQQRIALARALARDPNLVLADEPTSGMDPILAEETIQLLMDWIRTSDDRTVIWVTHDLHLASKFADEIVVMEKGALANWSDWPQTNPKCPEILREWIGGNQAAGFNRRLGAKMSKTPMPSSTIENFVHHPERTYHLLERAKFWSILGISQNFKIQNPVMEGASQITREIDNKNVNQSNLKKCKNRINEIVCIKYFRSLFSKKYNYNNALISFILSVILFLILILDNQSLLVDKSYVAFFSSSTFNPVVISSKRTIDDLALTELKQDLTQKDATLTRPKAYGRFEFPDRRVSQLAIEAAADPSQKDCKGRKHRREILVDIAALHPLEDALDQPPGSPTRQFELLRTRTDGFWDAIVSDQVINRLNSARSTSAYPRFICAQLRGEWVVLEVRARQSSPPTGRHGAYGIIISAAQWRDHGHARRRDIFDSVSVYFDATSSLRGGVVPLIRSRGRGDAGAANTNLIQSLAAAAGFERIAAAIDRTKLTKLLISSFIATAALVLFSMLVLFISQNFYRNMRPLYVILLSGANVMDIIIFDFSRIIIIILFGILTNSVFVILYSNYYNLANYLIGHDYFKLSTLNINRIFIIYSLLIILSITVDIIVSFIWCNSIKQQKFADRLKEHG